MTDIYAPGNNEGAADAERHKTYEVFNPDRSVGVACYPDGSIAGLYIGDGVRDNNERWLAAEIQLLARLAHQKSRVGRRTEMAGRGVLPDIIDQFEFPTEAQYRAMEKSAFGE